MLRKLLCICGVGCLFIGCAAPRHVLGTAPVETTISTVASARGTAEKTKSPVVTLRGTMVEKCPTAACWFHLKDKTGTTKVDVKGAYFTVTDVPVGTEVTVSGAYEKNGDEFVLSATGLRY